MFCITLQKYFQNILKSSLKFNMCWKFNLQNNIISFLTASWLYQNCPSPPLLSPSLNPSSAYSPAYDPQLHRIVFGKVVVQGMYSLEFLTKHKIELLSFHLKYFHHGQFLSGWSGRTSALFKKKARVSVFCLSVCQKKFRAKREYLWAKRTSPLQGLEFPRGP